MFPIGAQNIESWTTHDEIWNDLPRLLGHAARNVRMVLNLKSEIVGAR